MILLSLLGCNGLSVAVAKTEPSVAKTETSIAKTKTFVVKTKTSVAKTKTSVAKTETSLINLGKSSVAWIFGSSPYKVKSDSRSLVYFLLYPPNLSSGQCV